MTSRMADTHCKHAADNLWSW